jgi:hypothetical protein
LEYADGLVERNLKELPKNFRWVLGGLEAAAVPSIVAAAHIEDNGMKMATRVKTLDSMSGKSTTY